MKNAISPAASSAAPSGKPSGPTTRGRRWRRRLRRPSGATASCRLPVALRLRLRALAGRIFDAPVSGHPWPPPASCRWNTNSRPPLLLCPQPSAYSLQPAPRRSARASNAWRTRPSSCSFGRSTRGTSRPAKSSGTGTAAPTPATSSSGRAEERLNAEDAEENNHGRRPNHRGTETQRTNHKNKRARVLLLQKRLGRCCPLCLCVSVVRRPAVRRPTRGSARPFAPATPLTGSAVKLPRNSRSGPPPNCARCARPRNRAHVGRGRSGAGAPGPLQARSGVRAARTSSSRPTGVVRGAPVTSPGSLLASAAI